MEERKAIIQSLNALAIPLIVQSISSMIISTTDQAMVGRISVTAFGAVGSVYQFIYLLLGVLGCTVIIFNINGSRALGRKDSDQFKEEFTSSLLLSLILGSILMLGIIVFQRNLLIGIYGFSGEILADAEAYLSIVKWTIVFQMLVFTMGTYFKVIQKTKYILWVSLLASLLNLLLDYILIFGKFGFEPMGVRGAAYATLIALMINFLIYLALSYKDIAFSFSHWRSDLHRVQRNFHSSLPIMGLEILESNVFMMVITAIVARQGAVALASYLLLTQILGILLMPMFMYASATLTLVSGKIEDDSRVIQSIPALAIKCAACFYASLAVIAFIFRNSIFLLINPNVKVVALASALLFVFLFVNIVKISSTIFSYSLQAVGLSQFVLYRSAVVNAISLCLVLIGAYLAKGDAYLFLLVCALGMLFNYGTITLVGWNRYRKETELVIRKSEKV